MQAENIFESDILSQPQSLRNALRFYEAQGYYEAVRSLAKGNFDKIVLTGMGSSYAASLNAGTMLRAAGLPAYTVVASELLHYSYDMLTKNTLLVMTSQSGGSGEVVELCRRLPKDAAVVAVTNDGYSALAGRAQESFLLHVENEVTVSTRTYLASQALLYFFAKTFLGEDRAAVLGDLFTSADYLEASIRDFSAIRSTVFDHIAIPFYLALIGRGWSFATADAGALFIREVAKYPSISFESAQFRHGPIELVADGFSAIVFIPKGLCEQLQLKLATEIAHNGGKVLAVAEKGVAVPKHENIAAIYQSYVSQELAPIVNIVPVQAFANYVARERGYDVSVFRCGRKITDME